jgi:predicted glutamine amidotransferase
MKLFAVMCNQPERLGAALMPVRPYLRAAGPVARWGLAYDHGGEVLLVRTPKPSSEVDLASPLEGIASDCVIAQAVHDVRTAAPDNTPPFRFRRWMFAQLGSFDVAAVWTRAVARIPEFLRRNLRSKEPGDLAFHLFLAAMYEAGPSGAVDDPNVLPQVVRKALSVSSHLLEGDLRHAGVAAQLGSAVVANGRSMLALRRTGALRTRRLWLPNDRGDRDERFRCVMFISSNAATCEDGFEELAVGQVAMVRRDLTVDLGLLDS